MRVRENMAIIAFLIFSHIPIATVSAHTIFVHPAPRYTGPLTADGQGFGADAIKLLDQPCGDSIAGLVASGERREYKAGHPITLSWEETVEHSGFFAVYFSLDGDESIASGPLQGALVMELKTNITDESNDIGVHFSTVIMPDIACEECTLQVVQWMNGVTPYFSCADIRLTKEEDLVQTTDPTLLGQGTGGGCVLRGVSSSGPVGILAFAGLLLSFLIGFRRKAISS